MSPVTPSMAISRQPGTSVATMARPQAAASSRLLGNPFPARGEHGEIRLAPDLADIVHVAKPLNAEGAGELAELLRRQRAGVFLVAIAGEQQPQSHARGRQTSERRRSATGTPLSASMRPT